MIKRRDFLKGLLATPAIAFLPKLFASELLTQKTISSDNYITPNTITTLLDIANNTEEGHIKTILENISMIDPFYSVLPFYGHMGQALLVNMLYQNKIIMHTHESTKLIGDVELCGLLTPIDESTAIEVKAKSIGRLFISGIVTGAGKMPSMNSLHSLVMSQQTINRDRGYNLSFEDLTTLASNVTAKDEQVDFYKMSSRTMRSYKVLLNAMNEPAASHIVTLPYGRTVIGFNKVPVFRNSYIPVTETLNAKSNIGGTMSSVWAGCFDTGDKKSGLSAIYPEGSDGGVIAESFGKDGLRIAQYANLANFNHRALARLPSVLS